MNNLMAGLIGGTAVVLVAGSAMVFANHVGRDADAERGPDKVATRTVCTNERVVSEKKWGTNRVIGTVLGGAAGGVVGHQFGSGKGNDAATAVGALGGAYAGNRVAKEKFPDQEVSYKQRCREVPAS